MENEGSMAQVLPTGVGGIGQGRRLRQGAGRLLWPVLIVLAAACGGTAVSNPAVDVSVADLTPDEAGPADVGFAELPSDLVDGGPSLEVEALLGEVDAAVEPPLPCHSNADCESGICVQVSPDSDLGVCTNTCTTDESCPKDWVCKLVYVEYPDVMAVCIPLVDTLCGLCNTHADCLFPGSLCITEGEAYGYCGRACSMAKPDCPAGYECRVATDGNGGELGEQCMPSGGCCEAGKYVLCDDGNECTEELCHPTLGCRHEPFVGPCFGDEPCFDYQCIDGKCVGTPITIDDTPDGVDDDCDGKTDEDVNKNPTLSGGALGSCGGTWKAAGYAVTGVLSTPPYAGMSQSEKYRVVAGALSVMSNQN